MAWRYILAVFLSLLVMVAWQLLNPLPQPPATPPIPPAAAPREGVPAVVAPTPEKAAQDPAKPATPPRERKEIPVSIGSRIEYVADSRGACLEKVSLPEYHESVEAEDPYVLLRAAPNAPNTFTIEIEDPQNPARPTRIPPDETWELSSGAPDGGFPSVVFQYELDGVSITKTVTAGEPEPPGQAPATADPRHLKLALELRNHGTEPKVLTYRIYGPSAIDTEDLQTAGNDIEFSAATWGNGDAPAVEVLAAAKITHKDVNTGATAWIGVSNNYFSAILYPVPPAGAQRAAFVEKGFVDSYPDAYHMDVLSREKFGRPFDQASPQEAAQVREKAFKNLRAGFRSFKVTLEPGAAPVRHEYGLYLGPRTKEAFERYASLNFDGVNQHGTFGFLVKLFIWLLGILRTVAFGSWGFAIVLLTLVVKVCLHPINRRTQAGMQRFQKQMQKIKPQMDQIKEKFASNRMRMNQEVQKLWKENHINPGQQMAGCLMMFIQLPIWYGLYSTLRYAIGLRQASFLYITDLTRPDKLFHFGFSLPIVGWEWFNLLPVLYVILTIVNQRMQPKPEDPQMLQQYRMMTFMMVFFGFIFYQFPAGFMLYIMTSAGLGIIESKIIKAELRREDERGGGNLAAAGGGPAAPGAMYPVRSRKAEEERTKRSLRG